MCRRVGELGSCKLLADGSPSGRKSSGNDGIAWGLCDAVRASGCRTLHTRFNELDGHDSDTLASYKAIADKTDCQLVLEVVIRHVRASTCARDDIERVFAALDRASLWPRVGAIMVVPVAYLTGSSTPDCFGVDTDAVLTAEREATELYEAASSALTSRDRSGKIKLLAGATKNFADLNRRRPKTRAVDGVIHSVSAIQHDASDVSVMSTVTTMPHIADTIRDTFPSKEYWVGPCGIGSRGASHGKKSSASHFKRTPQANDDPRQRGCFGAAYYVALIARILSRQVESMCLGDLAGDRGLTAVETAAEDQAPMWSQSSYVTSRQGRQRAGTIRYHPAFHVVRGFGRAKGAVVWDAVSSDSDRISAVAFLVKPPTTTPAQSGSAVVYRKPGGPGRRKSLDNPSTPSPNNRRMAHSRFSASDWEYAEQTSRFTGEVWLSNVTGETQDVVVPLGYKASFAVALIDHTAATQLADHDIRFMDQTLSSVSCVSASRRLRFCGGKCVRILLCLLSPRSLCAVLFTRWFYVCVCVCITPYRSFSHLHLIQAPSLWNWARTLWPALSSRLTHSHYLNAAEPSHASSHAA